MSRSAKILQLLEKLPEEKKAYCYSWLLEANQNKLVAGVPDIQPVEDSVAIPLHENFENESDGHSEHSDHETQTEVSDSESSQIENENAGIDFFIGKDKVTKWHKNPIRPKKKTLQKNIVTRLPGVKSIAKEKNKILDCWELFFDPDTIQDIVRYTNVVLRIYQANYHRPRDCVDTNFEEMSAFIGLLYLAGVKKAHHLNLEELWCDDGTAPECFMATMSIRRFYLLSRAIRFDDIDTRESRRKLDNLAPIRKIFGDFVEKCKNSYQIGQYATIDEMLESFRGRCKFRVYMASKPAQYGIKMYALVDSRVFYTSNIEIYAGQQPAGPYVLSNSASNVVQRLMEPIAHTGRNITTDNYFTSIPLANQLLTMRTTIVGTLRKNKREIPTEFIDTKKRAINSSLFGYQKDGLLVSYKPKINRNVILLSTFHSEGNIDADTGDKKKPEVISFYNLTKGGVDVVDELKTLYSVARITRRWPLRIFFSLLDIGGINSQIIFEANSNEKLDRRVYLKQLGLQLIRPHLVRRSSLVSLPNHLKFSISRMIGAEKNQPKRQLEDTAEGICGLCPRRKNRKTKKSCQKCKIPLCNEHCQFTCSICSDMMSDDSE